MSVKPVLFAGSMVRALLENRKFNTRRVMPHQDAITRHAQYFTPIVSGNRIYNYAGDEVISEAAHAPGDVLYVRETWAHTTNVNGETDWPGRPHFKMDDDWAHDVVIWAADGSWEWCDADGGLTERSYWKPSIHMPRWASRITLPVTNVRVERLQDITEEDAKAEGAPDMLRDKHGFEWPEARYRIGFAHLWDSLNGKRPGFSWSDNPWVSVTEWKEIHVQNVDDFLKERGA